MEGARKSRILSYIIDVFIVLTVVISIVLVKKFFPRTKRAIPCNDSSIRYPHYRNETVTDLILVLYCFVFTIIIMVVVEVIMEKIRKNKSYPTARTCWSFIGHTISVFLLGSAFTVLSSDIIKYTMGSLRPDFVHVCDVNWGETACSLEPRGYVYHVPCSSKDEESIQDARQSFPSAHASISVYAMLFLSLFFQARLNISTVRFLRPLLQFVAFLASLFTCATRITDNKHHLQDVVCGAILGGSIALYMVFCVSNIFKTQNKASLKTTESLIMQTVANNDAT